MTVETLSSSVCFRCGCSKSNPFTRCDQCGNVPGMSTDQIARSLVLTDDAIGQKGLEFVSAMLKRGDDPFTSIPQLRQKYDSIVAQIVDGQGSLDISKLAIMARGSKEPPKPKENTIPESSQEDTEQRMPCPNCGSMILVGAKKCKFCKSYLGGEAESSEQDKVKFQNPFIDERAIHGMKCLVCNHDGEDGSTVCPYCSDLPYGLKRRVGFTHEREVHGQRLEILENETIKLEGMVQISNGIGYPCVRKAYLTDKRLIICRTSVTHRILAYLLSAPLAPLSWIYINHGSVLPLKTVQHQIPLLYIQRIDEFKPGLWSERTRIKTIDGYEYIALFYQQATFRQHRMCTLWIDAIQKCITEA